MTVVWKLSWCLRRCRRLLPLALALLGVYFASVYLVSYADTLAYSLILRFSVVVICYEVYSHKVIRDS